MRNPYDPTDVLRRDAWDEGHSDAIYEILGLLKCSGTKSGKHEWRVGEWDDARELLWCCQCAMDATDIIEGIIKSYDGQGHSPRCTGNIHTPKRR